MTNYSEQKFDTFIFDLDGTLLNTLEDLATAVNFAMTQKEYPVRTIDEVRSFIGNGVKMLIKRSVPKGTTESDEQEAYNLFCEYYNKNIKVFTKPYHGIINMLTVLKNHNCKTAVLTNKNNDAANMLIKYYFGNLIDLTTGKMPMFPTKPSPDSLLYTMDSLRCNSSTAVFIGDSDVDVLTAHNAGLPCIGVSWGFRGEEVLKRCGADFIACNSDDILDFVK